MCCMLSRVTSLQPQSPLLMEFSRQEYWSGLLFSTPGNLPDPGIKTASSVSLLQSASQLNITMLQRVFPVHIKPL